jgi:hypothetical protein
MSHLIINFTDQVGTAVTKEVQLCLKIYISDQRGTAVTKELQL